MWCLTPFSTVFHLYHDGQCTCPCFPGVPLTSTLLNILSKPLAAFPHNQCRNNGSGERGINPVVMTFINPQKEYWTSWRLNRWPSCSQVRYVTNRAMGLSSRIRLHISDLELLVCWPQPTVGKGNVEVITLLLSMHVLSYGAINALTQNLSKLWHQN